MEYYVLLVKVEDEGDEQELLQTQHKLEIWPGYVTAVAEYEGGLMLNLDVSHKVLRNQTAHELVR